MDTIKVIHSFKKVWKAIKKIEDNQLELMSLITELLKSLNTQQEP